MNTRMTPRTLLVTLSLTLAVALPSAATITNNADDYAESFEAYTNGTFLVGTNGWYSDDPTAAVVVPTNYAAYYTGGSYPIASPTRQKVLWIENNITNRFTGTPGLTNWIDHVIKPTFWDEEEYPDFPDDSLVAYFVNTNGQLVVMNVESYGSSVFSNTWVTIDSPAGTIGTNDWIRMTIALDFGSGEGFLADTRNRRFYRLWLNGTPIWSELGYRHAADDANDPDQRPPTLVAGTIETGANRDTVRNGFWFQTGPVSGQRRDSLAEVAVNGTGYLDDLALGLTNPFTTANIVATIKGSGSITPSGVIVVDLGGGTNFMISADTYYHISDVLVDGSSVGATNAYEFVDVTGNRSILAIVEPDRVGDDDVPIWWMNDRLGIDEDFDFWVTNRWHASKPLTIGQEYWTSTDPTDPDSLFRIATVGITNIVNGGLTNAVPYVQWYSDADAIDPALNDMGNYFLIYRTTNVADQAAWSNVTSRVREADNLWIDTTAPTNAVFYQIRVNPGL